jgi:hypothetical protein
MRDLEWLMRLERDLVNAVVVVHVRAVLVTEDRSQHVEWVHLA